jgi:cytochrome c biogenesis protein
MTRTQAAFELLASMRFAVSLLTVVSIASTLGTVLKQGEPYSNYLNQFGTFWFAAFQALGLYAVYSAWWFLVILAFLVASTSLCLWRNTPRMVREIGRFQLTLRERAFDNFHYRAELAGAGRSDAVLQASDYLKAQGFDVRTSEIERGTLIAAQAGMFRRLGYVLAHAAIVLVCVGGLADSEALLKLQLALGSKVPVRGDAKLSEVPAASRMGSGNPSFRGNTLVPEGRSSDVTVLNAGEGMLIQELPFSISLERFQIEHYSTGQPKLFASDVIVTDKDTGNSFKSRIEVNKPLIHKGIAVYQASFDDGGTLIKIAARNMLGGAAPVRTLEGRIGDVLAIELAGAKYQLEFSAFRPFNIENVGGPEPEAAAGTLMSRMRSGLDSASRLQSKRELRNVGPSFQYKLRDAAGQAREYHNYMLPIQVDGRWFLMTGMRENPGDGFRFLRMPLDTAASLDEYSRLRDAVLNRALHAEVGRRFALTAAKADALGETMRTRLQETAERVLETFSTRGFQSVADFLDKAVPDGEREKAAEIYVRVLQGAAWEAWMLARERAGLPRIEPDATQARFVQDSLNAVSDAFFYGVPVYMQMSGFDEVKASVFQLTRSPGKPIVYAGCALLVLGIFAMFYLRERRLWLLVRNDGVSRLAYAPTRRTLDEDKAFEAHRAALQRILN